MQQSWERLKTAFGHTASHNVCAFAVVSRLREGDGSEIDERTTCQVPVMCYPCDPGSPGGRFFLLPGPPRLSVCEPP